MPGPAGPLRLAIDALLSDDEWHHRTDIKAMAEPHIAPAVAVAAARKYLERDNANRRRLGGLEGPAVRRPTSIEHEVRVGRHMLTNLCLGNGVRNGTIERDGDMFRRRSTEP
jgi:hypothetical protein